jgi:hypothetical protein
MSVFQEVIADADLPVTIAAGVPETVVGEAPFNGTMTEAGVIPEAALVASDTLTRTLTLYNRGQAGAGTTVMATLATTTASGNWTAGDKKLMTLSAVAGALNFVSGDVFEIVETVASTGTVRPASKFIARGIHS